MKNKTTIIYLAFLFALLGLLVSPRRSRAQDNKTQSVVCRSSTFRIQRPLPMLRYKCKPGGDESDESTLKWPARVSAIKNVSTQLASLSDAAWWQTNVDDLNVCDFRKRVGRLSASEIQKFKDDYRVRLFGDGSVRMVIVFDPCYQTGYNGSDIFLLSRALGKIAVFKALEGYFSRVDNSIGVDYAELNGEKIVEIATANSMPPSLMNYYFAVDAKTNKISPRQLFMEGTSLSNQMSSDMLMSDPEDLNLPKDAVELSVIRDHKLAPTFSVYSEDEQGKIESEGKHFTRTIYKWNGHVYVAEK